MVTRRRGMVMIAWLLWLCVPLALAMWLTMSFFETGETQAVFLPGPSMSGHHHIETDCAACHAPSGGIDQAKCLSCHGAELSLSQDSHPRSKFTDPRNADRMAGLDALSCKTCHTEHQPGITGAMGVTLPSDYCLHCHQDIGTERPSHQGLPFSGCLSNGCHNYHDNRALNESFLAKHLNDPDYIPHGHMPLRDFSATWHKRHTKKSPIALLLAAAPDSKRANETIVADWHASGHARGGIGCADCHQRDADGKEQAWVEHPNHTNCVRCHHQEVTTWLDGKHGMRLARNLPPMTPAEARLPMHREVSHHQLSCSSCHSSHRTDTIAASANACLRCHSDEHSTNWAASPHGQLWTRNVQEGHPERGVSCATCHLPRLRENNDGPTVVVHDQNAFLRPRETMVKAACLQCHGLSFALDAIADDDLVRKNFTGKPAKHVPGIDWVRSRNQNQDAAPATSTTQGTQP